MRTVTAIEDYDAAYPEPLIVKTGDRLTPVRWDDEWHGWIWCSNARGLGGWFPERLLDREGESCVARGDFDGTELSIREGDVLEVEFEESGWLWCRDASGARGWVPSNRVR